MIRESTVQMRNAVDDHTTDPADFHRGRVFENFIYRMIFRILDMMPPHMICRGDAAGYDRIPDPVLLCRFLDAFQDQIIFLQTDNEISSKPTPFIYSHKIPSCCLYKINIAADEPILSPQTSLNNKLLVKKHPGKSDPLSRGENGILLRNLSFLVKFSIKAGFTQKFSKT